jgi:LacI family transcriptional regulator
MDTQKIPTIREISQIVGYSPSTISRFMNHPELLQEDTRNELMKRMLASNLPMPKTLSKKNYVIGLTISDPSSLFTSAVISAIEKKLFKTQYQLLLITLGERKDVYRYFNEHPDILKKIDGLIVSTAVLNEQGSTFFSKMGIPLVLLHTRCKGEFSILTNNYAGAQEGARYLLGKGYKDVAVVTWEPSDEHIQDRLVGFCSAFEAAHHPIPRHWIVSAPLSSEGGYEATQTLMEGANRPKAIFYGCDAMAAGGCRYLREQGIKVPDDVGVLGFDNVPIAQLMGITTLNQFVESKIDMVVEYLIGRLEEGGSDRRKEDMVSITPQIIERSSV